MMNTGPDEIRVRPLDTYFTDSVVKGVLQKLISAQIRQIIFVNISYDEG